MPGADELTPREQDVLRAMADGLSNEAIARKLHLAPKTIESVIRSIFIKLDILGSADENRRVRAVRIFLDTTHGSGTSLGGLPHPAGAFVGEPTVVDQGVAAVASGRVLTLTGPGGVGKTRLAIEVALPLEQAFTDGVWFLDLSTARDRSGVLMAAAAVLGTPPNPRGDVMSSILGWISGRDALFVVDNCEHVLAAAAEFVAAILSRCPTVAVMATSRQPLGLAGEVAMTVQPLNPATHGVELLRSCARSAAVSDDAMERIARMVDGLPLALLLAGSRLATLPAAAIEEQLRDCLHLRHRDASVPARHLTLEATLDWSYRLLPDEARNAFARCSVFEGGFDLPAFEAVAGPADVLSLLVDSSLVSLDRGGARWRYSLYETARRFAGERLGAQTEATKAAHLRHFRWLAVGLHDRWPSAEQPEVDAAFDADWSNLRAALVVATESGDVGAVDDIVGSSFPFAQHRVRDEHRVWAADACALGVAGPPTLAAAANWALLDGNFAAAAALAAKGVAACVSAEADDAALPVERLTFALVSLGRRDEAVALVPAMRATAAGHRDPFVRWSTRFQLANGRLALDNDRLVEHMEALTELTAALPSPVLRARCALFQVQIDLMGGESFASVAHRIEHDITPIARAANSPETEGWCLSTVAMLRTMTGDDTTLGATIGRLYELRYWAMLWMTADLALTAFMRRDDHEGAARLLGFLDRGSYPDTDPFSPRPQIRATLAGESDVAKWMSEGAAWEAPEAVAFILSRC